MLNGSSSRCWHGVEIGAVRGKSRPSLPPEAEREAVINAVVHTDYAQRGAPIRLSIFDDRLEVENPGLLPFGLTIEDLGPSVVDETDEAILESLGLGQGLATREVAAAIALSPRATRTRLARLVGRGLVREIGTGPQDPKRRYFLADRGSA